MTHKSIYIFYLLAGCGLLASDLPVNKDPMTVAIATFQQAGDLEMLERAVKMLDENTFKLNESEKAEAYLSFVARVTTIFDANYDVNPPKVFLNLSPGPGYESGIRPSDVKDPIVRADYQQRLLTNDANAKRVRVQNALRKCIDIVASRLATVLQSRKLTIAERNRLMTKISDRKLPNRFKEAVLRTPPGLDR